MHPFSAEVTFGAESFEDYMCQFMCDDVKFKDYRKASIPKFDSSKNDSFVHWYKLFCSTSLQWGVWCPPYESAQEDSIHGKWRTWLPASVCEKDSFMSGLIYTALYQISTFPSDSREQSAVEGCPPQAGYQVMYSLFRLHHPFSIPSSRPPAKPPANGAPNPSVCTSIGSRTSWYASANPPARLPNRRPSISLSAT
jgi:hypothetical protein